MFAFNFLISYSFNFMLHNNILKVDDNEGDIYIKKYVD